MSLVLKRFIVNLDEKKLFFLKEKKIEFKFYYLFLSI